MKYYNMLNNCNLCGHFCSSNRNANQTGYCGAYNNLSVTSIIPHFGEEPIISGTQGSGTIFFANCSLHCIFCQNYQISHLNYGSKMSISQLANKMIYLQEIGCHNVNLVTPTHYIPHIIESIEIARDKGLIIPIVYNTGGYDNPKIIELLRGYVDIYLTDFKFFDSSTSALLSNARNYPEIVKSNIRKMYEQVGNIVLDDHNIAVKGLIIRHLVIPGYINNSLNILSYIKENLSNDVFISLMSQYRPLFNAKSIGKINRLVSEKEYQTVQQRLFELGFNNGFVQDMDSSNIFIPDFSNPSTPFRKINNE